MLSKGKNYRKLTSSQTHTNHAHNTHYTHAYMNGKVYTCTHCGLKGYFAKMCYSKLNIKDKNVWVWENTNPQELKKI